MGTFSVGNALTDPLKATMFGVPFEHIPTYLKGYYKYKAGEVYKDENGNIVKIKGIRGIFMQSFTRQMKRQKHWMQRTVLIILI